MVKMNQVRLILFFSIFPISVWCQSYNWEKQKVQDALNTFTFEIPDSFFLMSEADKSSKVESYRKSIVSYTSMDRQTDFGINRAFSRFRYEDLELVRQFYRASLLNLYTNANFIQDEILEINGRKYAVFELDTSVSDEDRVFGEGRTIKKYVYVMYTVVDNNTIVVNFQAPLFQKATYRKIADSIMKSLQIK
jgi:hypothetical protein